MTEKTPVMVRLTDEQDAWVIQYVQDHRMRSKASVLVKALERFMAISTDTVVAGKSLQVDTLPLGPPTPLPMPPITHEPEPYVPRGTIDPQVILDEAKAKVEYEKEVARLKDA